jgi:hypothetical protein
MTLVYCILWLLIGSATLVGWIAIDPSWEEEPVMITGLAALLMILVWPPIAILLLIYWLGRATGAKGGG